MAYAKERYLQCRNRAEGCKRVAWMDVYTAGDLLVGHYCRFCAKLEVIRIGNEERKQKILGSTADSRR